MADVLLDTVFGVIKAALVKEGLLEEIDLKRDHDSFCIVLKLKKWMRLNIEELQSDTREFIDEKPENLLAAICKSSFPSKPIKDSMIKHEVDESGLDFRGFEDENQPEQFLVDPTSGVQNPGCNEKENVRKSQRLINDERTYVESPVSDAEASSGSDEKSARRKKGKNKLEKKKLKTLKRTLSATSVSAKGIGKNSRNSKPACNKKGNVKKPVTKRHQCGFCDYRSDCSRSLRIHSSIHMTEKPIACSICEFRCKREDLLKQHMKRHSSEKPYMCNLCDYRCSKSAYLREHKIFMHSDLRRFSCEHCDYTAKTGRMLREHVKRMHMTNFQTFQPFHCEKCDFKTVSKIRYNEHLKAHQLNTSYVCNVCGSAFMEKSSFTYHIRNHKLIRAKNISCPKCDKKFTNSNAMKSHLFFHTGIKEFKCRLCDLEFRLHTTMLKHHRKKHPNDAVFHCKPCDFQTNSLREINRHELTLLHKDRAADTLNPNH